MTETKWTLESYIDHNESVLKLENKFLEERDRRYTEVGIEREKALRIKETADLAALELARESQVYKDERNDAMREQTLSQTGVYATHADVAMVATKMEVSITAVAERMENALRPLVHFMQSSQGEKTNIVETQNKSTLTSTYISIGVAVALAIITLIVGVLYIVKK